LACVFVVVLWVCRLSGLSREEEDAARRRVLEEDIKRAKVHALIATSKHRVASQRGVLTGSLCVLICYVQCKLESSVSLLEEELRSTKSAWARRLSEERQGWQTQALDKVQPRPTTLDSVVLMCR
jgi:hypothetical protein